MGMAPSWSRDLDQIYKLSSPHPLSADCIWYLDKICLVVSEVKSFEDVDRQQVTFS